MGLTVSSTGSSAADTELNIKKRTPNDKIIAVAGNPNVGKSTLFNALTGMKQHTGNWPGKTVTNAQGYCQTNENSYVLVDIPGTYSLFAHSPEEEVARNFICFGKPDAVVVVCDATCLERNMNLVLQTLEITQNVVVCVNLLDEAKRKGIKINLELLSERLGVPVVGTVARNKKTLTDLLNTLDKADFYKASYSVKYPDIIEKAIAVTTPIIEKIKPQQINSRWLALRLLEKDSSLIHEIEKIAGAEFFNNEELNTALSEAEKILESENITKDKLCDLTAQTIVTTAEDICDGAVNRNSNSYSKADRRIDKILTSRRFGYPIMILGLLLIFWITISGANYISEFLSNILGHLEMLLSSFLLKVNCPKIIHDILVEGVFRVPAWVVSVMLPPMAIFFPLFTLLEDAGYLPRIAYNLDKPFKRCRSCGKQALTMCMGFGCNAAGVVGCRIIDSPRERLLAIITNNLVPCNGRFPAIISLISMFFITVSGFGASILSALILTAVILLGILATFLSTRFLSATLLKGVPSSYTLEMPPYRKPQIGSVLVRSIFDRTVFVLGRAVSVAVPAGIIIWIMANLTISGASLLTHCADFLDPFARLLGLDGVILIAFILGFPANEIVLPIIIMAYLSNGSLAELSSVSEMRNILVANGWTPVTAACTIVFSLMHWPCSTTMLTIKKETGSVKWTLVSLVFPTILGIIMCMFINLIFGNF